MTMLDRMRRHRDWLKWSLGLVCVAFVLFYIPDFLRGLDHPESRGFAFLGHCRQEFGNFLA